MPRKPPPKARASASNPTRAPDRANKEPLPEKQDDTIVFFHPDLGIGGAERLVVDAAVGLQNRGHRVVIFTNHCDPSHCFDECRDGTLDVRVRATAPIPMSIFNRLTILCAILRHLHMLIVLFVSGELTALRPRALIVDQLSAGLPFLTYMCPASPILFYCHFPDLLLASGREASALKRAYRLPFDKLEEWSMGFATSVAVNSEFTKSVVEKTWPALGKATHLRVVYPCVDIGGKEKEMRKNAEPVLEGEKVILSINRFERKKDVDLAIRAFAEIPETARKNVRLVIAGGHDPRIDENVQYLAHLQTLATSLNINHTTIPTTDSISTAPHVSKSPILFLPSVPTPTKTSLLRAARLLVYTPSAEHFGIVPLEAMRAHVPVLAATTGGPIESVVDGKTGWLRDTTQPALWTETMAQALKMSDNEIKAMGEAGACRVREVFGREKMAERLDEIAEEMKLGKQKGSFGLNTVISAVMIGLAFIIGLGCAKGFYIVKERVIQAWSESPLVVESFT